MKGIFKTQRALALILVLLTTVIPVFGSATMFVDDFTGPHLNSLWVTNLPDVPLARGGYISETYLGAPNYQFQTNNNISVLRMNTAMNDMQRVGWSLKTNFPAADFRYEVRFNTLTQSADTSIDAFVEVWVLNSTNFDKYDIVSLFGGGYAASPEFDAASSVIGVVAQQSASYQDNTFYRLVLHGGPGENIRASLCNDQGQELNGYDLGHTTAAYPAGFTIGLSQAIGQPGGVSPTDIAIASTAVTTTNILVPHGATATATIVPNFLIGINLIDGGYGYTNVPLVNIIGGGGSGAQAVAVVSNGVVVAVNVLNAGYGYTNAPQVIIDPPFVPNPVLNIAPMSLLTFSNLTVGGNYQLQRSQSWYWTNQSAIFSATNSIQMQMVAGIAGSGDYRLALNPVPAQAFATAQAVNGFVVGAAVTAGGFGYVTSPAVTISGGHGTNAAAIAHISGGVVTDIAITSAGIGYTSIPTIQIAPPPVAAVAPSVQPVMRVDAANLVPYDSYQLQFKSSMNGVWMDWNGILYPTNTTNSQYLLITNNVGFFRIQYVP